MQLKLSEKQIEDGCLDLLAARRILAFKIKSTGTYDAKRMIYRTTGKRYRKGVADILAMWRGIGIAIEVKSAGGKLSEDQIEFLNDWEKSGGLSIVIRSQEELNRQLDLIGSGLEPTATEHRN